MNRRLLIGLNMGAAAFLGFAAVTDWIYLHPAVRFLLGGLFVLFGLRAARLIAEGVSK